MDQEADLFSGLLDQLWRVGSSSAAAPLACLAYLLASAADPPAPASHHPSQVDLDLAPSVAAAGLSPFHDFLQAGRQVVLSAGG